MVRKCAGLLQLLVLLAVSSHVISADDRTQVVEALGIIGDFAERICGKIPLTGSGDEIELSGQAKAELVGLLKKLGDLGIEGAARYQGQDYQGVLQKDLAAAIQHSVDCKKEVWQDLKERLLPSAAVSVQQKGQGESGIAEWQRAYPLSGPPNSDPECANLKRCVVALEKPSAAQPVPMAGRPPPLSGKLVIENRCDTAVWFYASKDLQFIPPDPADSDSFFEEHDQRRFAYLRIPAKQRTVFDATGVFGFSAGLISCDR